MIDVIKTNIEKIWTDISFGPCFYRVMLKLTGEICPGHVSGHYRGRLNFRSLLFSGASLYQAPLLNLSHVCSEYKTWQENLAQM